MSRYRLRIVLPLLSATIAASIVISNAYGSGYNCNSIGFYYCKPQQYCGCTPFTAWLHPNKIFRCAPTPTGYQGSTQCLDKTVSANPNWPAKKPCYAVGACEDSNDMCTEIVNNVVKKTPKTTEGDKLDEDREYPKMLSGNDCNGTNS